MAQETFNAERQPIRLADLSWLPFVEDDQTVSISLQPGAEFLPLIDPSPDAMFVYVRFPPGYIAPSHWHPSTTVYIITLGVFNVAGEKSYGPGDFRWVKGGFAYGEESAGPEGCEFYLGSLGAFATYDPGKLPPPNGSWKDQPAAPAH